MWHSIWVEPKGSCTRGNSSLIVPGRISVDDEWLARTIPDSDSAAQQSSARGQVYVNLTRTHHTPHTTQQHTELQRQPDRLVSQRRWKRHQHCSKLIYTVGKEGARNVALGRRIRGCRRTKKLLRVGPSTPLRRLRPHATD